MVMQQAERSLLARIGFFLCHDGMVAEAEGVFASLAESAPDKDGPVVGLALCNIIKGECEKAIAMLDARLGRGSPIMSALELYKLLALGMAGRVSEAISLRAEMQTAGLGKTVETADLLLEELEKRSQS